MILKIRANNHTTLFGVVAVGLFSFGITAFIASSAIAPKNSDADTLVFTIGTGDYSASVSSADNINLNVESTPAGTVGIARDTITTTTNNPDGYKLYFSMDQAQDYDSSHPGNALYKDGNSSSSSFISPTTGTISAPSKLGQNTWGFALLGGANKQTGVPDTFSNFDATYIDSNGNSSDGTSGNLINPNNKFAAVPLRSNAVIVQESSSATPASGDQLAVYYGVNATTALTSGSYIGTVNYFLTADSSASLTDLMSLSPATLDSLGGQELTLATSLHTNYNFSTSDITVTLTDTNDSTNTASCTVTSVSTESGSVIAKCTTPALTVGTYDVTLSIPTYGKSYTKEIEVTQQTPVLYNMQEFTKEMCSEYASSSDVTLVDTRDNNEYTARYINGNCWMTSNLKYVGAVSGSAGVMTLDSTTSNVDSTVTVNYSYIDCANVATNNYKVICTDSDNGVQYENYTATAGQAYYDWNGSYYNKYTGNFTRSICPANWRFPTNTEQTGIVSYVSDYNPGSSDKYWGSSVYGGSNGWGDPYWYALSYNSSTNTLSTTTLYAMKMYYLRCVRST